VNHRRTFAIVGAGLAGAKAAETLREEGFDGRIVLIGDEPERPYERPPLSKGYLAGREERDKAFVHDEGYYDAHDIELRTDAHVNAIHPPGLELVLEDEERVRFDRLLLATGAEPRRLDLPGSDLPGVFYLRTLADSERLLRELEQKPRVAVIGAGWIGCEVAATAREAGCEVALVDMAELPLQRVLGAEVGAVFRNLHAEHGVKLHLGARLEALEGDERVERVRLADESIVCDLVVVGVGVTPRTELAQAAGLEVDNGIVVDARLATREGVIFAAGDVANAWHPLFGHRIRVEHWANALNQAPAAARSMLGTGEPYDQVPYFFTDQYDLGMEYAGFARSWDRVVFRGDPATREFIAFWLTGDRVVAGMNANVWDVTDPIQRLIRQRAAVDDRRLADLDVPLEDLVPAGARSTA
jgi:3-phenylpropionate/trans-cinnamate dioxygenase ferredoxin reductase subunit